jgi:hypothetical protein
MISNDVVPMTVNLTMCAVDGITVPHNTTVSSVYRIVVARYFDVIRTKDLLDGMNNIIVVVFFFEGGIHLE